MSTIQMNHRQTLNATIQRSIQIYHWAVIASFVSIGIGFLVALLRDHDVATKMGNPATILRQISHLEASGFFGLGIAIMILTPIVMIATSAVAFFRSGDRRYGLIATAVATILSLSIAISFVIG